MARITVSVDDALLKQTSRVLGTNGVGNTVNAALAAVVRQAALEEFDVRIFDITDEHIALVRASI